MAAIVANGQIKERSALPHVPALNSEALELRGIAMNRAQRVLLALYFFSLAYSFVWIPWSVTSSNRYGTSHQRLGYGWLWAGPRHPVWSKPTPKQQGQFSRCDLDPAPPNCSDVEDFEAEQAERWDAVSRQALPDITIVAFRVLAVSLIAAGILPLTGFRKCIKTGHQ